MSPFAKSNRLRTMLLVTGALLVAAAVLKIKDTYFDGVKLERVTIVGLPCPDDALVTPIWIRVDTDGYSAGVPYTGNASKTPGSFHVVMLPEDEKVTARVRIGYCRQSQNGVDVNCAKPTWIGDVQQVEVDTRKSSPELVLSFPGEHSCRPR